ncbi:MAG TPA: HEAT repeat domain-containing protein [Pyrinomonadaceae bacterium]
MRNFKDALRLLAATPALLFWAGCANLESTQQPVSLVAVGARQEAATVPRKTNAAEATGEVVVAYSPPTRQLTLREPVFVDFTVRNGLDQPVRLDLGQDRKESFRFVVIKPDGARATLPPWRREGVSRIGELSVAPREEFTERLLLNEWFDFPAPGRYEVEVSLATPLRGEGGKALVAPTLGRFVLDIGPRDADELKRVSAALLRRVVQAKSYEDAAAAATDLSHVADPVAVPDLEKTLTSGRMVEPIAIAGLARVGNEEAARVLISTLHSPDAEVAQLARAALAVIEQKSPDAGLKERIRREL